jgi:hypothetical protein
LSKRHLETLSCLAFSRCLITVQGCLANGQSGQEDVSQWMGGLKPVKRQVACRPCTEIDDEKNRSHH